MRLYVYLCPSCEREQLPPVYRTRCGNCGAYYSLEDERPEPKDRKGWWWERNRHRYSIPAICREVVLADPSVAPIVEVDDIAQLQRAYDADEAIAKAWLLHLINRYGMDGGVLVDAVNEWVDEEPDPAATTGEGTRCASR